MSNILKLYEYTAIFKLLPAVLAYNDNFLTPSVFLYFLVAFYHKEKIVFDGKKKKNYDGRPNFFGFINGSQYIIIIIYFDTKIVLD